MQHEAHKSNPVGCRACSCKRNPQGPVVPVTGTRSLSTLVVHIEELEVVEIVQDIEAIVDEPHQDIQQHEGTWTVYDNPVYDHPTSNTITHFL